MTDHHIIRQFDEPITVLYAVISDIQSYPDFMPGWRAVRISHQTPQCLDVEQLVSLAGVTLRFCSRAELDPPVGLRISATQFPFRLFELRWRLRSQTPTCTLVEADFAISFRARPLDQLAKTLAASMLENTINAFAKRVASNRSFSKQPGGGGEAECGKNSHGGILG